MHELALPLLIGLIIVALAFDFLNGLHDAANSIATVVATRLLSPVKAVIFAAFFNFAAYFLTLAFPSLHAVAETIGKGLIDQNAVTPAVIFGALGGAMFWNVVTWRKGIPSSSSHALIGSILGMSEAEIAAWMETQRDQGLEMARETRAGDKAGISIPNGADMSLMGVTGKLPDTDGPIRYHDEQIARAVLAHFLNLGTETGSWALGSTFADFFVGSLNAVALHIANTCQRHVVEDLVDANWGPTEPAPRLVAATIGEEQPATAEAIKALVDARVIIPDRSLKEYLRQRYKLPVKDYQPSQTAPQEDS